MAALLGSGAAADTGTAVKAGPGEYQAHDTVRGAAIAASVVPADRAAKIFSKAVSRNFVVVEVAVFPESGRTFDVETVDFSIGASFGAEASEVAWHGKKPPNPDPGTSGSNPVHVIGAVGIGVASETNPVTGQRQRAVGGYGGIGVDNGPDPMPAPPGTSGADATYALEGRLRGYELQDGPTPVPVSGYLYFPADRKHRNDAPVLEYSRGERIRLKLK
ncbi:MAG: hypothetical protein KGN84_11525 [Acidobacteriota bacterium]|nr:hypothetical protein [Acidobacteriota bacterium]